MVCYQFTSNLSVQFNANDVLDKNHDVLDRYDNTCYGPPANHAATLRIAN